MRLSTLSYGRVDTVVRIVRMSQSDQIRNRVHSRVHLSLAPRTRWYLSEKEIINHLDHLIDLVLINNGYASMLFSTLFSFITIINIIN